MPITYKSKNNWFERNPLKTISIIFSILFLSLLLITEMVLRYKSININNYILKRSIRLGEWAPFTYRHEVPYDWYQKPYGTLISKPYLVRVDKDGFIMPSKINENPDLIIVFLGGSTTECLFVNEENRFPYLVGRNIENTTGLKVNSYNSGVTGNNSFHSINILLNKVLSIKPDIVIMMHNINDLSTLLYENVYCNKNPYRSIIIEEKYPRAISSIIISTLKELKDLTIPNTYNAVRNVVSYFGLEIKIDEFANARDNNKPINKSYIINEFKKNLLTFIDICFSREITPVLMTQADRLNDFNEEPMRISRNQFIELCELLNQTIRDVGGMKNVKIIDLARKVPHDKKYIYDTVHFNDNGSIFVANYITGELRSLIKAKAPQ